MKKEKQGYKANNKKERKKRGKTSGKKLRKRFELKEEENIRTSDEEEKAPRGT